MQHSCKNFKFRFAHLPLFLYYNPLSFIFLNSYRFPLYFSFYILSATSDVSIAMLLKTLAFWDVIVYVFTDISKDRSNIKQGVKLQFCRPVFILSIGKNKNKRSIRFFRGVRFCVTYIFV
jgi:hypothetical protein